MGPNYEFVEHTADIRVHAFGTDLPELFKNCAQAMTEVLFGPEVLALRADREVTISVSAAALEELLVEWLSKLLYLSSTSYSACVSFKFNDLSTKSLTAVVGLCKAQAIDDIKAVTHHDLKIIKVGDTWEVEVTFDI